MRKRIVGALGFILAASVLVVSFQNCASDFDIAAYSEKSLDNSSNNNGDGGGANPTNPTPTPTAPPVPVPTPTPPIVPQNATEVAVGELSSCALKADGTAYCWGNNSGGQIGDGTMVNRLVPTAVNTAQKFRRISIGSGIANGAATVCAVTLTGDVYCWGSNSNGQIGAAIPAGSSPVLLPQRVLNLPSVVDVKVGATFACARTAVGQLYCWGSNASGELGNNTIVPSTTAVQVQLANVADFDLAKSISSFPQNRVCANTFNGIVYCWGYNPNPSNAAPTFARLPVAAPGVSNILKVEAGLFQTCGITATKNVLCWGFQPYIGTGQAAAVYVAPTMLASLTNIESLALSYTGGCAVSSSGSVFCWGYNYGLAGNSTYQTGGHLGQLPAILNLTSPTAIPGVAAAKMVDTSSEHTCIGFVNGVVQCLGFNALGGLGNNTVNATHLPQNATLP